MANVKKFESQPAGQKPPINQLSKSPKRAMPPPKASGIFFTKNSEKSDSEDDASESNPFSKHL